MLVINVLTILNISFSNLCNFESKNIKTKLKASNNPPNKSAFIQMATNTHDSRLHRRFPCSTRLMLENKPKKKTSVRKGKTVPFPFFTSIFFLFSSDFPPSKCSDAYRRWCDPPTPPLPNGNALILHTLWLTASAGSVSVMSLYWCCRELL